MNTVVESNGWGELSIPLRGMRLRQKIIALLLAVFTPMSLLMGLGAFRLILTNDSASWHARHLEATSYVAFALNDSIARVQDMLILVTSLERDVFADDPDLLESYLLRFPMILEIVRTDVTGVPIASAYREDALLGDVSTISDSSWYIGAKNGHSYVGEPQGSAGNEPYVIMSVVGDDGGVVAARVSMAILDSLVWPFHLAESAVIYVVTSGGVVIARVNGEYVLRDSVDGHPTSMQVTPSASFLSGSFINATEESVQAVSMPIPRSDWFVVSEVRTSEIYDHSRKTLTYFLVVISSLALGVTVIIYRSLHELVLKPIRKMQKAASRICSGDFGCRINLSLGDELGQLSDDIDRMVAQLQSRNDELYRKSQELVTEVQLHKATQIQLWLLNNSLEQRIAERAAKLELLNAELLRSNNELQEFAYVASHDLQEPLRKIRAFGDRLIEKYSDALDERGKDYVSRMQASAERMQKLIDALLTYSRVTTAIQPHSPVDLNQVLQEVVSDLDARLQETSGKVASTHLATIEGDATQIRMLLQNLIGNALKFRAVDRAPEVVIEGRWLCNHDGFHEQNSVSDRYQLIVSDNGIGFEPQFSERIFQVFQRLHGRAEYEGTGIGLAICRKIVERHGGRIVASGLPGEGATFTVTLPAIHPAAN